MQEVQDLGYRLKLERTITLQKRNPMFAWSEDLFETIAQFTELYY